MKRILYSCVVVASVLVASPRTTLAQRETTAGVEVEKDIALLRRNLRSEKKKIIALNVPLTETEATKFWPVYDQYAADMSKHYDAFYALIKDYAATQKTMSDAQATEMLTRWSKIQVELTETRQQYIPRVQQVIPGRKAAHFFQVDRRLYQMLDLQIASEIPLIVP